MNISEVVPFNAKKWGKTQRIFYIRNTDTIHYTSSHNFTDIFGHCFFLFQIISLPEDNSFIIGSKFWNYFLFSFNLAELSIKAGEAWRCAVSQVWPAIRTVLGKETAPGQEKERSGAPGPEYLASQEGRTRPELQPGDLAQGGGKLGCLWCDCEAGAGRPRPCVVF